MKKIIVTVAAVLSLFSSCTPQYDENSYCVREDAQLACLLKRCCKAAYDVHSWMSEDGMCIEYECCWEYVPTTLRAKYESGATLSVYEMEAVIASLEDSPSFIDTLAEFDEFIDLDYYRNGIEWFSPTYGYEEA